MRFPITVAAFTTLASSVLASKTFIVQNNCPDNVFLTITRSDQSSSQSQLASNGGRYSEPINGSGNSYGLTKSADYYSASTPKLIAGVSDSAPTIYYSVSNVNGDPFAGQHWQLSGTDASCGVVGDYTSGTKACADSNDLTITLC